ncbi:MAG: glycosyl hydrolase family 8 [Candidatus Dormibacteria bacterium]
MGTLDPTRLRTVLTDAWAGYKQVFIHTDGRVVDPTRDGSTTSEGQGYALLRAVWMSDQPTFESVWRWTAGHLQHGAGAPLASLWSNGRVVDSDSASDADSDVALALLYGARRFGDTTLRQDALTVLNAIWQDEVASINGMNVLTAGNWAKTQGYPGPVINPSYFAPYAYRAFAGEDKSHPWATLIDSSYTMLDACTEAVLNGTRGAGLPPNWCAISRTTGGVVSFPSIPNADDYGYDAFRVMWRVALDAIWNAEPRARAYLEGGAFLRDAWNAAKRLDPVYGHDGSVVSSYDDPTIYGGDIGNFVVIDPAGASQIVQLLLASFHPSAPAYFGDPRNYYEQNWVWFGLALSGGVLVDLDRGHG